MESNFRRSSQAWKEKGIGDTRALFWLFSTFIPFFFSLSTWGVITWGVTTWGVTTWGVTTWDVTTWGVIFYLFFIYNIFAWMHGYNNNKTANVDVPLQYNIPIQGHIAN